MKHNWKAGERLKEQGSVLKTLASQANVSINNYDIIDTIKKTRLVRKQCYRIECIAQGIAIKMKRMGSKGQPQKLMIKDGNSNHGTSSNNADKTLSPIRFNQSRKSGNKSEVR